MLVAQYYIWIDRHEDWNHATSESRRQKAVECTVSELSEGDKEEDESGLHRKVLMSLKSGYDARADNGEKLELLDHDLSQLAAYYVQRESQA